MLASHMQHLANAHVSCLMDPWFLMHFGFYTEEFNKSTFIVHVQRCQGFQLEILREAGIQDGRWKLTWKLEINRDALRHFYGDFVLLRN